MRTIVDLPWDLVTDILSRVPLASLSAIRSTCKTWNVFSKHQILGITKKHEYLDQFMMLNSRIFSLRFDLRGTRNKEDNLVDQSMKQVNMFDQISISQVFHCDGLLLCVTKEVTIRLAVWNPYLGQTRWIRPRTQLHFLDGYALGYDNDNNYKILRFDYYQTYIRYPSNQIDVYDFSSDSWGFLEVNLEWDKLFYRSGVSLKGNTYFFGRKVTDQYVARPIDNYLVCFDFAKNIFGPRLPLPFGPHSPNFESRTLASVMNEKLAVLYQDAFNQEIMEIWITTKIEPNAVSWNRFLKVNTRLINGLPHSTFIYLNIGSFFIDEEERVAVVFYHKIAATRHYRTAYIIGEDGYFKCVNMGEEGSHQWENGVLVSSSYVPSLVQLKKNEPRKR